MKTPIQELIDWTNEMENSHGSLTFTEADFRLIKQLREIFKEKLEKEKKAIIDAYHKGAEDFADMELKDKDQEYAKEYYKETFKQ